MGFPSDAVSFDVPPAAQARWVSGEVLVQFSADAGPAARAAALSRVGGQVAETLPGGAGNGALVRVALGEGVSVERAADILSHLPGVSFAEPNYLQSIQVTSNDPGYTGGKLWGMYGDLTSPANAYGSQSGEAWAAGYTGSAKVAVGVIDTGIDYTHPDLYLNVWLNPGEIPTNIRAALTDVDSDGVITFRDLNAVANTGSVKDLNNNGRIDAGDLLKDPAWANGVDGDTNGYVDDLIGWDFVNNDNDPYDDNNHGTHVSGTIGAVGGNGAGVAGVNWAVEIIALKFLSGSGSGSSADAIKALQYFTAASKAGSGYDFSATNNSWGGGGYSAALLQSIVDGAKADILFVAAAGNGGFDGKGDNNDATANYPSNYSTVAGAGYEAVIAVASITSTGTLSTFSNYGPTTVDLAAPGQSIYSTLPGGTYGTYSGTSMATPHVTGAVALYSAANGAASADTIRQTLLSATDPTPSLESLMAAGRLDVGNLLTGSRYSGPNLVYGTKASETVTGTADADKIWGVPGSGTFLGKGTVDVLVGNGGNDTFVLGDSRGRFYDDGRATNAGLSDYAAIRDFSVGDRIQVAGPVSAYLFRPAGSDTQIYYDSNLSGGWDSRDELIAVIKGYSLTDSSALFSA